VVYGRALASGFATAELHDHSGHDRELYEGLLDAKFDVGATAVAAIEDHAFEQRDLIAQAVHLDRGQMIGVLGCAHQRQQPFADICICANWRRVKW